MFVIFDTNIYRHIGWNCFNELMECESKHSIVGLCNPYTAAELLVHLANPKDKDFYKCWSAIRRLVQRCSHSYNESMAMRFLPDAQSQRCNILFGEMPDSVDKQAHHDGWLLSKIAEAKSLDDLQIYQSQINEVAKRHKQAEKDFQNAVNETKKDLKTLDEQVVKRSRFAFLVDDAATCLGMTLSSSDRQKLIDFAMKAFAIPMEFAFSSIYKKIVDGANFSKSKNVNSLEDFQILFSVSSEANKDGTPVCLVTNEKQIITAAKNCGSPDIVRSRDEYLDFLGVDPMICDKMNLPTT
jgi:hypothetical protein